MELNKVLFPAPTRSYTADSFPGQIIWIPRVNDCPRPPIPCLYLPCIQGSSKTILYFHGNAQDIGMTYQLLQHTRSTLHVHIIAVQYPGYGIYPGNSSQDLILEDCQNIFNYLVNFIGISPRDLIVFGRSIGSGPATWLASQKNPGILLLMSAYTSIRGVAKHVAGGFLKCFVKERFNNIELIKSVKCPTLLIHGQKDLLIPFSQSQKLSQVCGGPSSLFLPREMDHIQFDFFDDLTIPISNFLVNCGVSVKPLNMRLGHLNFPHYLFEPTDSNYKPSGRWNRFIKKLQ